MTIEIRIGDKVKGSQVYGKYNKLEGEVISKDEKGIITIRWEDGQVARFCRNDIKDA